MTLGRLEAENGEGAGGPGAGSVRGPAPERSRPKYFYPTHGSSQADLAPLTPALCSPGSLLAGDELVP